MKREMESRGYFIFKNNWYYVEFTSDYNVINFNPWPSGEKVSDAKVKMALKRLEMIEDKSGTALEILSSYRLGSELFVVNSDNGIKAVKTTECEEGCLLLYSKRDYEAEYYEEISKYIKDNNYINADKFWYMMAVLNPMMTPDEAILYIKDNYEEFYEETEEDRILAATADDIAKKALKKLTSKDKKELLKCEDTFTLHFGYGLWIRNEFIHGKNIDNPLGADYLSNKVINRMKEILIDAKGNK